MASQPSPPAPVQFTAEAITPDLVDRMLTTLPSTGSRRAYRLGIDDLVRFAGKRTITLTLLHKWRDDMAIRLKPASANLRIAAARKFFRFAARAGVIDRALALELREIARLRQLGQPTGNWLTGEQCRALLALPHRRTVKGKRTYCVLALLLGCALRRTELANLDLEQFQMREGRWVLADLRGKGGRVRTVAVPAWVKEAVDGWTKATGITSGRVIRRYNLDPAGVSTVRIFHIVQKAAEQIGVPNFGPHDLRRTCAKLCRGRGGRIEQIQAMLGHSSIATTERYLGTVQNLKHAVNDDLGIW